MSKKLDIDQVAKVISDIAYENGYILTYKLEVIEKSKSNKTYGRKSKVVSTGDGVTVIAVELTDWEREALSAVGAKLPPR